MSKKFKTPSNWASVVEEYQQRDCTQEEFCRKRGINPGCLSYHLTKHRKSKTGFLPVPFVPAAESREVVIELPAGVRILIRG
ncbi:MAG: hypothetical protein PHC51_07150 [bacterium]|nr:hypothetical protein [bacterium]